MDGPKAEQCLARTKIHIIVTGFTVQKFKLPSVGLVSCDIP